VADLYSSVTQTILDALEQGVVPWRKPWRSFNSLPVNAISNRPYRGVNAFLLGIMPYTDHRWLTFKQVTEQGGKVRKGEKASLAVFWKLWEPNDSTSNEDETEKQRRVPILRHYHLFNAEQCENLSLPDLYQPQEAERHQRIQRAEQIIADMPNPPTIAERGSSALYRPSTDHVQVPKLSAFTSPDTFYATLFHELGHATGHESRLARKGVTGQVQFGSGTYSQEELVAELTSAFLCAKAGLDNSLLTDSASYIDGWLDVLNNDRKAVVYAAAQAQKAADYITTVQPISTPQL
jgi:antirestriction protein ArdC